MRSGYLPEVRADDECIFLEMKPIVDITNIQQLTDKNGEQTRPEMVWTVKNQCARPVLLQNCMTNADESVSLGIPYSPEEACYCYELLHHCKA